MTDLEVINLFKMRKLPATSIAVEFPKYKDSVQIELISEDNHYKFIADLNRKGIGEIDHKKMTYQLRYAQVFQIRRLDLNGSHVNPDGPPPFPYLQPYVGHKFLHEDHVHIYLDGWDSRWALPIGFFEDLNILTTDDLYDKMEKFFKYCSIEGVRVTNVLF